MDEADEAALAASRMALESERAERALYLAAVERYALDPDFYARVKAIEYLIVRSENDTPTPESRVGMWIGAAVALHLAEHGHLPGLPEWSCPACGATTRARMADRDDEASVSDDGVQFGDYR
jgi:hypothetical protein